VAGASFAPGALSLGTTYLWKIVPKNACGDGAGCSNWSFTTVSCTSPPSCASSPSPVNGATSVTTTPVLTWGSVSGATSYDVYFGTTLPGTPTANVAGASYNPGTLSQGTIYYWKIVPKNACGVAAGCSTWSFTTGTSPGCLPDLGDANGSGDITAYDASLILQHVVGLISLDAPSQCRSDANGGADITAFDASLVLQCVVSLCANLSSYPNFHASCTAHGHCP